MRIKVANTCTTKSSNRVKGLGFAIALALAIITGNASAKEMTFGYVPASLEYPYNVATVDGFKEAAKAAGVATVVLDPRGQVEGQGNAIDDLLARHVDAIGFLPLDSVVAQAFVDKVASHNIPVVAIALQVGDSSTRPVNQPYPKLTALVATDNFRAGEVSGEIAAKILPASRIAKIAIVEGDPAYTIVKLDNSGFESALKKAGVKYTIVALQPTDWTPEQGESVCQNFLTAHPDLDLIFSQADDMAIGCARAIDAMGSKVKLIATGGGSKLGDAAIASGEIYASVCTRPKLLGKLMFKVMYEAVTKPGTPKARYVTYDMPAITKNTLAACPDQW
jgi:ribose transport system substrate-binding protein